MTLALLDCEREAPPPRVVKPAEAARPLAPWSWHFVGGLLVIEGEVDQPTELVLKGRYLSSSLSTTFGPVRWEMFRPPKGEVVDLRTAEGRLLAHWDLDAPLPKPAPVAPPKPMPKPAPVVPVAAPAPRPAPVVAAPAPKPVPVQVPKPGHPAAPKPSWWRRILSWALPVAAPAPRPAPAPKPIPAPRPAPAPKPIPEPRPVPVPVAKPEPVVVSKPHPVTAPQPSWWRRLFSWGFPVRPKPPKPKPVVPAPVAIPAPVSAPVPVPAEVPAPKLPPPAVVKPKGPPAWQPVPVEIPKPPRLKPIPPPSPAPLPATAGLWPGSGAPANLVRGPKGARRICMTFDGGSTCEVAVEVLDLLKARGLHTTFFLTGDFLQKYPELAKRMVREGHEVGNHSFTHPHLAPGMKRDPRWTRDRFQKELLDTDRIFYRLVGRPMDPFWRSPFGEQTPEIRQWAEELGYRHVGWSEGADTLDWATVKERKLYRTGNAILDRLYTRMEKQDGDGLIVLMHLGSGRPSGDRPAEVLGPFLDRALKEGWQVVPVSEYVKGLGLPSWDPARRIALINH